MSTENETEEAAPNNNCAKGRGLMLVAAAMCFSISFGLLWGAWAGWMTGGTLLIGLVSFDIWMNEDS